MMMKMMKKRNAKALAIAEKTSLARDTRGLSTVEYLILLVVIAVAGITVWKKVGASITTQANTSSDQLDGL